MKTIIKTENAPKPIGPYNQAIKTANMLFVSGQIPVNPATGKVDSKDIVWQTTQVMENIKAIVAEAGFTMNDIVKTSIFISDMNNFAKINETYGKYFDSNAPARETIQVARLPLDVDVEISVIAAQ